MTNHIGKEMIGKLCSWEFAKRLYLLKEDGLDEEAIGRRMGCQPRRVKVVWTALTRRGLIPQIMRIPDTYVPPQEKVPVTATPQKPSVPVRITSAGITFMNPAVPSNMITPPLDVEKTLVDSAQTSTLIVNSSSARPLDPPMETYLLQGKSVREILDTPGTDITQVPPNIRQEVMVSKLEKMVWDLMERTNLDEMEAKDMIRAISPLIEKMRLLRNQSTQNVAVNSIQAIASRIIGKRISEIPTVSEPEPIDITPKK